MKKILLITLLCFCLSLIWLTSPMLAQQNDVKIADVYEALLKSKDDNIGILTNIINWLLAFASVAVTILIVIYGWLWNKIRKQSETVSNTIVILKEKEEEVSAIQQKINQYLESVDFTRKLEDLENRVHRISQLTSKWEQEELEKNRARKEEVISSIKFTYWHDGDRIESRLNDQIDHDNFQMIKLFYDLTHEKKLLRSLDELLKIKELMDNLYKKYRSNDDPPA